MKEPIKATIHLVERYAIEINGTRTEGFRREGHWEGMAAYKTDDGLTVVVEETEGERAVMPVFGMLRERHVIKLSPQLIPTREAVGG